MPRPNAPRSIAGEVTLARRVAYEREARGWSYDTLARRMTGVGCPINASALQKIEKGDPPRRITVDEFAALSVVFELPLRELMRPPEAVLNKELGRLLNDVQGAVETTLRADATYKEALRGLAQFVLEHPEVFEVANVDAFVVADVIETLRHVDSDMDRNLAERVARIAQLAKER